MNTAVLDTMDDQITRWEADRDPRWTFLSCYRAMTSNMLTSVQRGDFHDAAWVERLLHRFAEYYFDALRCHEEGSPSTPAVWKVTFEQTAKPETMVLQRLFLGVNAHINYDLVLTLVDLLRDEWAQMDEISLQRRLDDHRRVNTIIAATIDAVQDDILEREAPALDLIDKGLGRLDELLIARLITHWRDRVWTNAIHILDRDASDQRHVDAVAQSAMDRAMAIARPRWYLHPRDLI